VRLASWFSAGSETMLSVRLISVSLARLPNQIALAVENALAYREIRELKEQLSKEKLYLEDEIRTEMNFAQIIGNSARCAEYSKEWEP